MDKLKSIKMYCMNKQTIRDVVSHGEKLGYKKTVGTYLDLDKCFLYFRDLSISFDFIEDAYTFEAETECEEMTPEQFLRLDLPKLEKVPLTYSAMRSRAISGKTMYITWIDDSNGLDCIITEYTEYGIFIGNVCYSYAECMKKYKFINDDNFYKIV